MIQPVNTTQQNGTLPNSGGNSQASALTSDFETFLRMLTAQAKNQDPLEPLDSSEYASQLAQFSMVEQQVKTNEVLSDLSAALGNTGLGQLANWVGMDVQVAAPFRFNNTPVALFGQAAADADRAEIVIRDQQGSVVDRYSVPVDQDEFQWAGVNKSGNPIAPGIYSATIESFRGRDLSSSSEMAAFSRVIQAQSGDSGIVLTLDSGAKRPAESVSQIRTGG